MSEHRERFQTFEDFWPFYVSQHLDPTCRALHVAGTSLALCCVAVAPFVPPALLAAPVVGYGLAWLGHGLFEKNRPATFTYPRWSLRGDFRMWRLTLAGKMAPELQRARALFAEDIARPAGEGQGQGAVS